VNSIAPKPALTLRPIYRIMRTQISAGKQMSAKRQPFETKLAQT